VRTAVIDSGPLISLAHLNLAEALSLYFNLVFVPKAVQTEVNRKQRFRYRLNKLYKTGIFASCRSADQWNVKLLRPVVDEGEAEGLIQAQERYAAAFIGDEVRARQVAGNMGLTPVGTVRILARLQLEGHVKDIWTLIAKLQKDLAFRVTDEIVRKAIARAPEPI
jgi:predicted nucleic acid-binding protein